MVDYIDTCIFLAVTQGERHAQRCRTYLNTVGYKHHPCGVLSHFVISELFVAIITKLEREAIRTSAAYAAEMIALYADQGKIRIERFISHDALALAVREQDYSVSEDDVQQICAAILIWLQSLCYYRSQTAQFIAHETVAHARTRS